MNSLRPEYYNRSKAVYRQQGFRAAQHAMIQTIRSQNENRHCLLFRGVVMDVYLDFSRFAIDSANALPI